MKKMILTALLAMPALSAANTTSPFPNAKPGITIMPLAEMKLPDAMQQQMLKNKRSLVMNGYEDTTDTDANVLSLVEVGKNAKAEIAQFDNDQNPYDTHLKSSVAKLKLAFRFNGIPDVSKENVIGFAAAGGYKKNKGWDGVVEFISDPKLGICSYTTYQIEKVILDKETTEFLVNQKPSNKTIAGNWNTGFLYTLNWYKPDRMMSLACTNKMFETTTIKTMIDMATKIDKS